MHEVKKNSDLSYKSTVLQDCCCDFVDRANPVSSPPPTFLSSHRPPILRTHLCIFLWTIFEIIKQNYYRLLIVQIEKTGKVWFVHLWLACLFSILVATFFILDTGNVTCLPSSKANGMATISRLPIKLESTSLLSLSYTKMELCFKKGSSDEMHRCHTKGGKGNWSAGCKKDLG